MGQAARALLCSDLPDTARSLLRIVEHSEALCSVGVARSRGEAIELMPLDPHVLVVDARLDCNAGLSFCDKVAPLDTPVLLVVEPGEESQARARADAHGRRGVFAVGRDLVERGEASSDAVVRTRMCLLAANARHGGGGASRRAVDRGALQPLVAEPFDAAVVLGSAGTPHLLPRLLPSTRVGGAPLVIAVHHNPRFSSDFVDWVGELSGRVARQCDVEAVAAAGVSALFAATPETGRPDGPGPDLGGLLERLAARGLRLLVCVASGMEDPVAVGLRAAHDGGGHIVTLCADACAQPALVQAAHQAGVVDAEVDVEGMAWVLQQARARAAP